MALTFPRELPFEIRLAPERDAECRVFDALKSGLPGDYRIFYSVAWLSRRPGTGAWDGEADFVVIHPRNGILVVEVKGGFIRREGDSGEWWTQPRGGGKAFRVKDPIAQAKRSKFHLAGAIEALPQWVAGKPKLGHVVAFPHCDAHIENLGPDCPPEIVIYSPDLLRIGEWIESAYGYWSGSAATCTPVDSIAMGAVVNMLSPTVELRSALQVDAIGLLGTETAIAHLTSHQELVLRSLAKNRRVAIGGGAGTGKTMLALTKAKHLANQGFRTLLTCYNRPLADYLKHAAGIVSGLDVADFHQVCLSAIKASQIELDASTNRDFWDVTVPNAFVDALAADTGMRFDAIVVDEAQDFSESWWTPIELALEDPVNSILYVFYDDNQRLYQRAGSFPGKLAEFSLCENLRNTKQIYDATTKFYDGTELISLGPSGSEVEYILASDVTAQRKEIGRLLNTLIKSGGIQAADIAILSGRSTQLSLVYGSGRIGSYQLSNQRIAGMPRFESIARFKGLESPIVILTELEDHVSGSRDETIYVALSRARSSLFVVGSSDVIAYVRHASGPQSTNVVDSEYMRRLMGGG